MGYPTGFKDKNGNAVFSGDILTDGIDDVNIGEGAVYCKVIYEFGRFFFESPYGRFPLLESDVNKMEIVENIDDTDTFEEF